MKTYTLPCSECDGEGQIPSNAFISWGRSNAKDEKKQMCSKCTGESDIIYLEGEKEFFNSLADRWEKETKFLSSVQDMKEHPCYKTMKKMGAQKVVPLALEKMANETTLLLILLSDLIKKDHNPIPYEMRGKISEITMAWIEWGIERNYIHADCKKIRQGTEARERKEREEEQAKLDKKNKK